MTNTPTDKEAVEKIAKIKARADAATPGPWSGKIEPQNYPESDDADLPGFVRDPERREICYIGERYNYTSYETDLTFIAHAREDVPWLLAELERVTTELDALKAVLVLHHQWHLTSGPIGLPDGAGGWIEVDIADAYSDSSMCERTMKAIEGVEFPSEPMPRGGIQTNWWQVAVLQRRELKQLKAQLSAAQEELAGTKTAHDNWQKDAINKGIEIKAAQAAGTFSDGVEACKEAVWKCAAGVEGEDMYVRGVGDALGAIEALTPQPPAQAQRDDEWAKALIEFSRVYWQGQVFPSDTRVGNCLRAFTAQYNGTGR